MSEYELLKTIYELEKRVKELEDDRELNIWDSDPESPLYSTTIKITPCDFAEMVFTHLKNKAIHVKKHAKEEKADAET